MRTLQETRLALLHEMVENSKSDKPPKLMAFEVVYNSMRLSIGHCSFCTLKYP
jgi:hypothetical protein